LQRQWQDQRNVKFLTPATNEEVRALAADCDVFVFPTRFEGFPVALVETMSAGCVPVASDLPGGIRELIEPDVTGFRTPLQDIGAMTQAIEKLHNHRQLLEDMSKKCYDKIYAGYNAQYQSPKYQELFLEVAERTTAPRHHEVKKKLGSRLDHPLLPNFIVRILRKSI